MKQQFPDKSRDLWPRLKDHRRNAMGPFISKWTLFSNKYKYNESFRLKIDTRIWITVSLLLGGVFAYSVIGALYALADHLKYHQSYAAIMSISVGVVMIIAVITGLVLIFKSAEPLDNTLPKDVADYDKRLN